MWLPPTEPYNVIFALIYFYWISSSLYTVEEVRPEALRSCLGIERLGL
jgi:hypothetical protein